ncbi:hypothetical protein LINGRAHAP2_LOCUS32100 [Linum grandiflorum]
MPDDKQKIPDHNTQIHSTHTTPASVTSFCIVRSDQTFFFCD